jgi:hypothetical protein
VGTHILAYVLPTIITLVVIGNFIFRRYLKHAAPAVSQPTEQCAQHLEMAQQVTIATTVQPPAKDPPMETAV